MLTIRKATEQDLMLYFEWTNDAVVRLNSINTEKIDFESHKKWFTAKVNNSNTIMLVFLNNKIEAGQIRIELDKINNEAVINYSVDKLHRGKGLGTKMLVEVCGYLKKQSLLYTLTGLVKPANAASVSAFIKAGYTQQAATVVINGEAYLKFSKKI